MLSKLILQSKTFDEHGFAQYQRQDTPQRVLVNGQESDDQWEVTYNRDICIKYDAYINVEHVVVCSLVKYLYKYVNKGHDCATIALKAIPNIMIGNNLDNIYKGMKSRNSWIVATYRQLSYIGRFFSSAYSINILLYRNFNATCLRNN